MTGRNTPATEEAPVSVRAQVLRSTRESATGPRLLGALAALALIVLAGVVAPGDLPGIWTWVRVVLVWLLTSIALISIAGATLDTRMPRTSPLIIWGSLLLAVVISLTFTAISAALAIIILLLLLLNVRPGGAPQPAIFWLLLTVLTPLWVWSAFEAWDAWLLMLIPIAVVGIVTLEHAARAGVSQHRAHRLASWVGIVGLGAALLTVALLAEIAVGWIALGAIVAATLAPIDLFALPVLRRRIPSVVLPVLALAALALGWLVAL